MTIRSQTRPTRSQPYRQPTCFSRAKTKLFAHEPYALIDAFAESARPGRLSAHKSVRDALDLCTELRELFLDRLIAAIDVIDPLDVSLPLRYEAG